MPMSSAAVDPRRATAVAALIAAVAAAWVWVMHDQTGDATNAIMRLPWAVIACAVALVGATVVHFVCAGATLRAVSGRALPWGETGLVQLAAAATDRVVPTGMGGAALNGRYLLRSGLAPGAVATALGGLAALGAVSDAAYVAGVITLGPRLGAGGASGELKALVAQGISSGRHQWWLVAAVVGVAGTVILARLRGRLVRGGISALRHAATHAVALATSPRRLATATAASMATTAVLSVGFVTAVATWGHAVKPLPVGALIALYWAAAAAGNATPLPAFFGVTEAALIGGLVVAGYTSTSATVAVVVFRLVTYWLPLPVGIWATRRLRRVKLL